jgi:flagellin-like protein
MGEGESEGEGRPPRALGRARYPRFGRSRRGVSEVVATILLLALTVVLFSAIFAFVTTFPAPPAQNSNQFQAKLVITPVANGSGKLTGVSILHLAGPAVPSTALIYLKSAIHPTWLQFSVPYTVAAGGIAGSQWNLGQTWLLTSFTGGADSWTPDNITVYIISNGNLLFNAVVPGAVLNLPPTFLSVATTPSTIAVGEAFSISAVIQGVVAGNSVTVTLSGLPGYSLVTAAQPLNLSSGTWTTSQPAGKTTASGTYYVYITATSSGGKTATSAVPVYITSFSTLIATAFSLTSGSGVFGTCSSSAHSAAAACQGSTSEYYYTVTIASSAVTFGSLLFEVENLTTLAAQPCAGHCVFAIAANSALTTPVATWSIAAPSTLLVTGAWTTTYAATFSGVSPLTTSYTISVDLGTSKPSTSATTLAFLVIGTGAYSGQATSVTLPVG